MIRLAYVVMIAGIVLCFVFSKNQKRSLRKAANEFAFAFVKLSNYVSPKPPKTELATEALPGGKLRTLPADQQPEAIQRIIERANSPRAVELFAQMDAAADLVSKRASINRTYKAQFQVPIDQMLMLAHTFLVSCEDLSRVNTPEQKEAFDSFLMEQPQHRMLLLKRITGDAADEYRELNKRYAKEMERMESDELEAKRGRKTDAGPKDAEKAPKAETEEAAPVEETAPAEEAAPAAEKNAPKEDKLSKLRDDWRGWGCC